MSDREVDDARGAAWAEYCRALQAAGDHVLAANADASAGQRDEGLRYLLGLVVSGARQALEISDPQAPTFLRNPDSSTGWGAENADNQYLWARVEPGLHYRIHGIPGTAFDFLIEVKQGYMQLGDTKNFATLTSGEVKHADDGGFVIDLSTSRPAGARNWLALHPEARYIAIRQYFCDWALETPNRFRIEMVRPAAPGGEAATAPPVARLPGLAGEWTLGTARFWTGWTDELRAGYRPGEIAPARSYEGGADDIFYGNDFYRLGRDEAWIIEVTPPDARYWQFQLCDLWFKSADWAARQTSLNHEQVRLDSDGRARFVLSHTDPGVPNWLDAGGHKEGVLQYRWIWSNDNPRPTVAVHSTRNIRDGLPEDTPHVTEDERRECLRVRRLHRAQREPAS